MLNTFVGMVACGYNAGQLSAESAPRLVQLTHEFKKLLAANILTTKSPAAYADKLHISESYLNEALRKVTGFPVSYWIVKEALIEAKRLLYYSQLSVKEIAHQLGYPDPAYFSRLFKKATQITPQDFRLTYRDLSN